MRTITTTTARTTTKRTGTSMLLITITFRGKFFIVGFIIVGSFFFTKIPLRMIVIHRFSCLNIELEWTQTLSDPLSPSEDDLPRDSPSHRHRNTSLILESPNRRNDLALSGPRISLRSRRETEVVDEFLSPVLLLRYLSKCRDRRVH